MGNQYGKQATPVAGTPYYGGNSNYNSQPPPPVYPGGNNYSQGPFGGAPGIANGTGSMLTWVPAQYGQVPPNAIPGGRDNMSGETYYVGRAWHDGYFIPGKVHPSHQCCYVSFGGGEHKHHLYEVLVDNSGGGFGVNWVRVSGGMMMPQNAVPGGTQEGNERLFIGRHQHNGALVVGKVHPSHRCLYVPYGGQEIQFYEFEVLVSNQNQWGQGWVHPTGGRPSWMPGGYRAGWRGQPQQGGMGQFGGQQPGQFGGQPQWQQQNRGNW